MTLTLLSHCNAVLLCADGTVFQGEGVGASGMAMGEVCFNTGMSGYQEVITDLSYAGQVIVFTFPHIGNVGCNVEDLESLEPACRGIVLREKPTEMSNYRGEDSLQEWLKARDITGICGIDTRALTRHIRRNGAQNVLIWHGEAGQDVPLDELKEKLAALPTLKGQDLATTVSAKESTQWNQTYWDKEQGYGQQKNQNGLHVVAIDYGQKLNILRSLAELGCQVTVVPASATAEQVLALKPSGVFLSNGPGDPAATGEHAVPVLRALIDADVPIFGICLGHQLLSLALGAQTEKMHQGHRGANHPVKNLLTNQVEITSQNHGFVVSSSDLPDGVEVTHLSLFDGTIEGVRHQDKPVFSVQYHPESSPGPHDSRYLFEQFVDMMREHKNQVAA